MLQTEEEGETAGDCRLSKSISKVVIYVDLRSSQHRIAKCSAITSKAGEGGVYGFDDESRKTQLVV